MAVQVQKTMEGGTGMPPIGSAVTDQGDWIESAGRSLSELSVTLGHHLK